MGVPRHGRPLGLRLPGIFPEVLPSGGSATAEIILFIGPFIHCILMPFLWVHKHREDKKWIENHLNEDVVVTTALDPEAKTTIFSRKLACGKSCKVLLLKLTLGLVDLTAAHHQVRHRWHRRLERLLVSGALLQLLEGQDANRPDPNRRRQDLHERHSSRCLYEVLHRGRAQLVDPRPLRQVLQPPHQLWSLARPARAVAGQAARRLQQP